MNTDTVDKYIKYCAIHDICISNICVAQIEGETDWICFDTEHNIIIKRFESYSNAQDFHDALYEKETEQLVESGYF